MKTPRDVLLNRHKEMAPALDSVRRRAIESALSAEDCVPAAGRPSLIFVTLRMLGTPFRELIWPARRIWAGFAVAWLVIVLVNFADADRATKLAGAGRTPSAEMLAAWQQQQQRLMAELMRQTDGGTADRPRNSAPQPRSQWPARASAG